MDRRYTIPSKPTRYHGTLFRSRLEAHWAVYFDLLGWEWEYEPQAFHFPYLSIGYCPDFWLRTGPKCWVEVKPKSPNLSELTKAALLCTRTKAALLFAVDLPDGQGMKLSKLGISAYQWPHRKLRYQAARHSFSRSRK